MPDNKTEINKERFLKVQRPQYVVCKCYCILKIKNFLVENLVRGKYDLIDSKPMDSILLCKDLKPTNPKALLKRRLSTIMQNA